MYGKIVVFVQSLSVESGDSVIVVGTAIMVLVVLALALDFDFEQDVTVVVRVAEEVVVTTGPWPMKSVLRAQPLQSV